MRRGHFLMMKGGGRGRVNYAEAAIDIQACIDLIRGYISNNYRHLRRRARVIRAREGRACNMSVGIAHRHGNKQASKLEVTSEAQTKKSIALAR